MDNLKLIEALEYIKQVCSEHKCIECPMADNEAHCLIGLTSPCDWVIITPEKIKVMM